VSRVYLTIDNWQFSISDFRFFDLKTFNYKLLTINCSHMLSLLRKLIPERSPLRLAYHKAMAVFFAYWYRFPGKKMKIVAITGTSGKSTTAELMWFGLQKSGKKCGMLSGIQFHFGDETLPNHTLRTTLSSRRTQKYLRHMVREGCEIAVLEVSSHAIDQHRLWGVPVDIAVLTNVANNEHLDYHKTFAEYVQTKAKMFLSAQKVVLNQDDEQKEVFEKMAGGAKHTYGIKKKSDIQATKPKFTPDKISFDLKMKEEKIHINVPLVGRHNLENLLAAISVLHLEKVRLSTIQKTFENFKSIPGRLEIIQEGQPFSVIVDHTYKPPALRAVLQTLKKMIPGRLIVVWGGTGSRLPSFWEEAGQILDELADEIILTTDDPYKDDPKKIARIVRQQIHRKEGDRFFEIEDRYEAIRYALLTAEKKDTVLIAGRGHEATQTIGKKVIPFDDRAVAREILQTMKN
jgi:UDP-N-acetylmuramoyl-L-alanyl-D-glutamate--2,6-diaminopimelate ligase